jgi:hypothetical protein
LHGEEAVKLRWGSVACSGRSGRGERCLFWWYCCAFAVLNIGMGVQPTCNDLWAPDPGRVQAMNILHQFRPSSSKSTVMIAGDRVQTQHNSEAMQNLDNGMLGGNYLDRPRKEDRMSSNGRNTSNGTISMSMGQIDWRGLWAPFNSQQSTAQMDEQGLWVPYYTASPAVTSPRSGNVDRHTARKQQRLNVPWAKINTMGPASRNNQGNGKRSSGDGNTDNLNKSESTMLDDGNDHDESSLDGGDNSGSSITLKGGDNCDSGRSHNSAVLDVDTLLGGKMFALALPWTTVLFVTRRATMMLSSLRPATTSMVLDLGQTLTS